MCLATSNNLCPKTHFFHKLAIFWSAKNDTKTLFFHPPSPFPGNFCNCNSGGICTALQFLVQLPLLYTVWSNAYSEISPVVTLRALATSCVKDYKGHSIVQTSFIESPNSTILCSWADSLHSCHVILNECDWGVGIAQWLEHQTRDWKVVVSVPSMCNRSSM